MRTKLLITALLIFTISLLTLNQLSANPPEESPVSKLPTPVQLSPTDNATGVSVYPDIVWSFIDGANTYMLMISTSPDCKGGYSLLIRGTNYSFDNAWGVNTKLFWKVRVENYNGYYRTDTSDWSPVFNFTTEDAPLKVPVIKMPDFHELSPTKLTFNWDKVDSAEYYNFQIALDTGFKDLVLDTILMQNQVRCSLIYKKLYYFRVNANNSRGMSPWTKIKKILINRQFDYPPSPAIPANGATRVSIAGEMKWSSLKGGDYFHVQLSKNIEFSAFVIDTIVQTYNYFYSGLEFGTYYYWHIKAYSDYDTSGWSSVYSFRTEYDKLPGVPEEVVLQSPDNGALYTLYVNSGDIYFDGPDFKWLPGETQVDHYWFEIANNENFNKSNIDSFITESTIDSWHVLNYTNRKGLTYWRVKAGNEAGWGTFSEVRYFSFSSVGVDDNDKLNECLLISPNPAGDYIIINVNSNSVKPLQNDDIHIFNSLGECVLKVETLNSTPLRIDLCNLPPGVYYLRSGANFRKFVKK